MVLQTTPGPHTRSGFLAASVCAAALLGLSGAAVAGECPAGKTVADGSGQKAGATMPKAVTDTVLGSIDLARTAVGVPDRQFRMRRLVVQPGGEVPWHSHDDRPALIYIVEGTVTEYASTCLVPIVHKAGELSVEMRGTSHWWKNTGSKPAVLLSSDLLHMSADPHVM